MDVLNYKKIYLNATTREELKSQQKEKISYLHAKTLRNDTNSNAILFLIDNKYIIIDSDGEDEDEFITNLLKENNIDTTKCFWTKSISHCFGFNNYKHHYYFKKGELDITSDKTSINGSHLDLLCHKNRAITEDKKQFKELDENDFPTMTHEILDKILNYNKKPTEPKIEKTTNETKSDDISNDDLEFILDNIDDYRFTSYGEWINLYIIFTNEGWDLDLFDEYSSRFENYDKDKNDAILKNINRRDSGLTKATLYSWLKEDNIDAFKQLQKKQKDNSKKETKKKDKEINLVEYHSMKVDFEKNNFKILNPISYATITQDNLIIRNKQDFKNVYENKLIHDKSFINEWLKDPTRLEFRFI